jgi:hypothetical protein
LQLLTQMRDLQKIKIVRNNPGRPLMGNAEGLNAEGLKSRLQPSSDCNHHMDQ